MSQENKISKNKKLLIILLIGVGIFLLILSSCSFNEESKIEDDYIEKMEDKLERFLLNVEGINEAKVIITLESTVSSEDKSSYYNKNDNTLPHVRGVAVACSNGGNDKVKAEITDIVSKYLGIGSNKVKITDIKR